MVCAGAVAPEELSLDSMRVLPLTDMYTVGRTHMMLYPVVLMDVPSSALDRSDGFRCL